MLVFDPRLVALLLLSLADESGDSDAVDALSETGGPWMGGAESGGDGFGTVSYAE